MRHQSYHRLVAQALLHFEQSVDHECVMQQFQKLAEGLPYSKHIHSTLICPVTLEVMNEDNPPMVAPSGAVYSEKAVCQISTQHNGMFKDPETGVSLCLQQVKT